MNVREEQMKECLKKKECRKKKEEEGSCCHKYYSRNRVRKDQRDRNNSFSLSLLLQRVFV